MKHLADLSFHCLYRVVKEEISDDNAKLPCFNGRVVSWVSIQTYTPTDYIDLPHLTSSACVLLTSECNRAVHLGGKGLIRRPRCEGSEHRSFEISQSGVSVCLDALN